MMKKYLYPVSEGVANTAAHKYPRQESNLRITELRRFQLYPLSYRGFCESVFILAETIHAA